MRKIIHTVILIFISFSVFSENRVVNLVVAYKTVHFSGKNVQAIAVNNQIPAPTLHFKQGDHVVINVFNHLNESTIIHWHGIILPWQMDGVEGISQRAIQPGKMFRYHFTLRQSGTYWYHSHAGFQEQQGLYGALIIDPKKPPTYHYNKDEVIVLSDWSNTNPNTIFENLKRDGDYYSPRFPLQASLFKFMHDYKNASQEKRAIIADDYKMMQQMRMGIYDFSDVAYDAFLLNGKTNAQPWTAKVNVGDVVRLRFIDAGASTNFNVKIPGYDMRVIHDEGNDVIPYNTKDFFITPGETLDVLIKIKNNKPSIIYAESADTVGAAIGVLVTSSEQTVTVKNVTPFPAPKPVTQEMMSNMMPDMQTMTYESMHMSMPTEASIMGDHFEKMTPKISEIKTIGTKYQNLSSLQKTNNPNKPIANVIRMELFGYMGRYIWMINGVPEHKAKPIILQAGKRYRIIFTNPTMMHHPMHMHGHWFILRNGHGGHDPLLHTIDLAPGATVVADVDTDASGQWIFHCHLLYHMMGGMARVFQYQTLIDIVNGTGKPERTISKTPYHNRPIVRVDEETPIIPAIVHHPMGHPTRFYTSNFLDVGNDFWSNTQEITFTGMYGRDYNKLKLYAENVEIEKGKVVDANMDIFYWRLISQFWAIEGGANYTYRPTQRPYWQPGIGLVGLMPYFIDTEFRVYEHNGSIKFDPELSRDTQITNNFFIRTSIEGIFSTKTVSNAAIGSGINEMQYTVRPFYRIRPGMNVFAQYQYTKDYGALRQYDEQQNESPSQNIITVGLTLLF